MRSTGRRRLEADLAALGLAAELAQRRDEALDGVVAARKGAIAAQLLEQDAGGVLDLGRPLAQEGGMLARIIHES